MVYCAGLENRKCEMDSFGQDWSHLPKLWRIGICELWRVVANGLKWPHFFAAGYLLGVFIQGAFVRLSIPSRRGNRRPNSPDKREIRPFRDGGSKAMNMPPLITYPARPTQRGRLALASPKRGLWYAEPKLNGWRALTHMPTGRMWNRHGALLTSEDCFQPALAALAKLATRGLVWAGCEALERRHNLGCGTRSSCSMPCPNPAPRLIWRDAQCSNRYSPVISSSAATLRGRSCAVP